MGISDLGFTPSSTPYSYTTDRFLGTAQLDSLSTYGPAFDLYSLTFQLNVVLVLTSGSRTAAYWIQDVPYLNTSTQQIIFIDNVWNLTSSSLS
ncbi:MAG TPA: thermopsin family protease, partial [Thermoplasmata archaeon]|nr:thermopsin family protease [Thermoplasmata archaeon]